MNEPLDNLRAVCSEHAPKPDPKWLGYTLEWFIGKHVKLKFETDPPDSLTEAQRKAWPNYEYMWVKVIRPTDATIDRADDGFGNVRPLAEELMGLLDSDPLFVAAYPGEEWLFNRDEICDVYSPMRHPT